jgi:hypothetical protein
MQPIIRNDSTLREEGYDLTQTMVINPSDVRGNAPRHIYAGIDSTIFINGFTGDQVNGGIRPPGTPDPTPVDPGDIGLGELTMDLPYPYLIVTTPELKHAVRRIVALKRQKGYNVKVATMDDVMHDSIAYLGDCMNGQYVYTDSAGSLRQYLKRFYKEHGTKYVLFLGDIPYRVFGAGSTLTELYFSDLSANWLNMLATDRLPELYVGRVMSKDTEQVNNYTDKLFRYELNPGHGNTSYLRKAFFSEGREYTDILNEFKSSLSSIYPNPIIINDYNNNNSQYPKGKNVIDTLRSNPVGFICIYNHGNITKTRVYGYDNDSNIYFIKAQTTFNGGNGLNCLQNKSHPMIYYSPSCATIPFDNKNMMSFGESFILGKDYGGPIYIGYTREVYPNEGKNLSNAFAHKIMEGYVKLGVAFSMSKVETGVNTFTASLIQGCFGDPELEMWTNNPQCYSDIMTIRTDNSIILSGIAEPSTIVAYRDRQNIYKTKIVSTSNITITDASPNSTIILFKHNFIPYIAPLKLQNETIIDSCYIIANEVIAGNSIDSNRTNGDVTVNNGVEYEIEASGNVALHNGFKVEKGATFAVYPSSF